MSSSAALKVLFALAVIWASYETSIALNSETVEQGSSTVETEITSATTTTTTTAFSEAEEQQATTANYGVTTTDVPPESTTESVPLENEEATKLWGEFIQNDDSISVVKSWEMPVENENNKGNMLSGYIYELDTTGDGGLQDISEQESRLSSIYLNFESMKESKTENKTVYEVENSPKLQITSYLADSDTTIAMTEEELLNDARNKTMEADVISAFFIAPEDDEANEIDKTQYSGHPIVVNNLNEDLVRNERFTGKEETKTLTNDILAPIQAAVSLSRGDEGPVIEKQILHEGPVYKTYIEIQKSIPYEIKETPLPQRLKESRETFNKELGATQFNDVTIYPNQGNELNQHSQIANELPIYTRNPTNRQYYRYPMYYVTHRSSGNHATRHTYDSGTYHQNRPILPVQYLLARYQPQLYGSFVFAQPYTVASDAAISGLTDLDGLTIDQHPLKTEQLVQYIQRDQHPPFRPSHPVFASQYPPNTYHVMSTMRGRTGHARTARSKQLRIEYGGFKPPMVPSIQIEDEELTNPADGNTSTDEQS